MSKLRQRMDDVQPAVTATAALAKMNERARPVALADITLDWRLQFRLDTKNGLDDSHVADLKTVLADGGDTDPIILYQIDDRLVPADGFHRIEAYRQMERETIPAIVRSGTFEDAEECAEEANLVHRKKLGLDSRKYIFARRVQREYQTNGISWRKLSDRAIGEIIGAGNDSIARWFRELETGVAFATPSNQQVLIQVSCDRSVVYGRDGNPQNVEAIREANRQRAEEERQRKAKEKLLEEGRREQERLDALRALSVIGKVKYIAGLIMSSPSNINLAARMGEAFTGLSLPDEQKTHGHYRQAHGRYTLRTDVENRLNQEMKLTRPYTWYQSLLDLPPHIWEQAETEAWDEHAMQAWLASFAKNQQAGPPSNRAPLPGKTPAELAAEKRRQQFKQPTANAAKFKTGDMVRVVETGELDEVVSFMATPDGFEYVLADADADVTFAEDELAVYRLEDTPHRLLSKEEAFAQIVGEDEAETPTPPTYPANPPPSNGQQVNTTPDTTNGNLAVTRYLKAQKPAAELLARWAEARNLEICEHLEPDSQHELQKLFEDVAWAAIDRWAQTLHWAGYQERGFMNAVAELFEKLVQE